MREEDSLMKQAAFPLPLTLWGAALLLPLCACSASNEPALNPVRGKVFYKGKPAAQAVVWFHPEAKAEAKSPRPHATVESDGSFQVSTHKTHDGAPAGRYRVTVIWTAPGKFSSDDAGPSRLPARYSDPKHSGLPVVEIKEGSNDLPPFQLSP